MPDTDIKPGDWVRFMRDGRLFIGEVRYVEGDSLSSLYPRTAYTDVGAVLVKSILEVRRAN